MVGIREVSVSPRKMVSGIALIMAGLTLLIVIPHPLGYQAQFSVTPPSLSTVLVCSLTIGFGVWVLADCQIKMFLWPLVTVTLWTYLFLLPILLLPLTQEVLPIVIGFSGLPLVF
ncbi:MAG: hypothetical protein JSV64_00815 [Candidatus Bathyarchaeota archaeon]|nr:MAG: hypothetical protein JSV64_00815 [Candidatus Bathyarchaeota archaeon]